METNVYRENIEPTHGSLFDLSDENPPASTYSEGVSRVPAMATLTQYGCIPLGIFGIFDQRSLAENRKFCQTRTSLNGTLG